MRKLAHFVVYSIIPVGLYAHTNGLPIGYTGANAAAVDNSGATCIQCHQGPPGLNQGSGRVTIFVGNYTPGVQQTIVVKVEDNTALKFGFQITARLQSDQTKQAGTLAAAPGSSGPPDSQVYCAPDATKGDCGTALEFGANTSTAVLPDGIGTRSFRIYWTPPARDLGPVVFYAAAVAEGANNAVNGNVVTGDHVYSSMYTANSAGCTLSGTPTIGPATGVTDAASYRGVISSKQLISIFGSGFAAPGFQGYSATKLDLDQNGDWPTDLACIAVEVGGVRVPLYYVSQTQINAQAPVISTSGIISVTVILNPDANQITSKVYSASSSVLAPSLFTFNGQGTGNAAALDATKGSQSPNGIAYLADTSVIPSGVSAAPGDVISIYGTGFGETSPSYAPGVFADPNAGLPKLTNPISVTIGGVTVPDSSITYAGLAFDAPGLYQVNVKVPNVPDGDQLIFVRIGGANGSVSQGNVTIPVKH